MKWLAMLLAFDIHAAGLAPAQLTLSWSASGIADQWEVWHSTNWTPSPDSINSVLSDASGLAGHWFQSGHASDTNIIFNVWNFVPPSASDITAWSPIATSSVSAVTISTTPGARAEFFQVIPRHSLVLSWNACAGASGYLIRQWSAFATNVAATATTNIIIRGLLGGEVYSFTCTATNRDASSAPSPQLDVQPPLVTCTNSIHQN